ncbi:MAG TPA: PIN domain-containing protein [Gemmataceae bacterium]|nr:PIN domain-containing protein [Gemmataceae bacterium]
MLPLLILDTSVLIAALRSSNGASHALLRLVGTGRFEVGVTTALVLEYESVAARSLDALGLTSADLGDLLDYLCRVGRRVAVRFRVRPSLPDPGDEFVLEAAVACGAGWIVSHNVRHLAAGAARFGVEVLTPAEALRRLGVGHE